MNVKNKDLLEYLRNRRLASLKGSRAASDRYNSEIQDHADRVKHQITGEALPDSFDAAPAQYVATLFYRMKDEYSKTKSFARLSPKQFSRSKSYWSRVVTRVMEADVLPETYIRAQFSWFHDAFGTTPELKHLATDAAVERASLFSGNTARAVVGNNIKHSLSMATMFRHCEQQVRKMCRAQKVTREEFYIRFVLTGNMTFPKAFLQADPVYKRVTKEYERS